MSFSLPLEKYTHSISEVTIGATSREGGNCSYAVKVGGESTMPYLLKDGSEPHRAVVAMEITDIIPEEWPQALKEPFKDVFDKPGAWASKCLKDYGADLICLKLQGAHPDFGNRTPEDCARVAREVLKTSKAPLVILGCGDDEKDSQILPAVSLALKGQRCLIGDATEDNYRTLTATCLADGHNIIAESPIDVNIAKQLNILISDMGMPVDKIVINPTIGGLGYGMEYAYSIMERARLAALSGDSTLACPFICFVGQEAWRAKEACVAENISPNWGSEKIRGVLWEAVTAVCVLESGADILIMRHPEAVKAVKTYINSLNKKAR